MINKHVYRALGVSLVWMAPVSAAAMDRVVGDVPELRAAIAASQAGDSVILRDGVYAVDGDISCSRAASAANPITVRAQNPGGARIEFNATEGFKVSGAGWVFRDLHIKGVCATDSACEHAFHLFGDADGVVISNNKVWNYNAHIKSNGVGEPRKYPDDVLVIGNEFYSEAPRQTGNPVTPIDVVGGRRWRVTANHIHDFAKAQGNNISYAAFLKGNSKDGVIERNLIVCEQLHTGNVRLGLSFGGGGTSPDSICEDGTCTPEHEGGIMRNNIIANCPSDVGIYINKGKDVKIFHNLLYKTTGVDVRFAASVAEVRGNMTDGRIRTRDGGTMTEAGNLTQLPASYWPMWFVAPEALDLRHKPGAPARDAGMPLAGLTDDFCGAPRDARPDGGAVEGDGCDTSRVHPAGAGAPDMGMPDMGAPEDMGGPVDMAGAVDMGGEPAEMGGADDMSAPADDMASAQDMSATPDQGGADMTMMPGGADDAASDEGCAAAGGAAGPGSLWWLAALGLALARRRMRAG